MLSFSRAQGQSRPLSISKDLGSLSSEFLSCDANPPCASDQSEHIGYMLIGFGDKGNPGIGKYADIHTPCCSMSNRVLCF